MIPPSYHLELDRPLRCTNAIVIGSRQVDAVPPREIRLEPDLIRAYKLLLTPTRTILTDPSLSPEIIETIVKSK